MAQLTEQLNVTEQIESEIPNAGYMVYTEGIRRLIESPLHRILEKSNGYPRQNDAIVNG